MHETYRTNIRGRVSVIEIVVVVIVLAVLVGMLLPTLARMREEARRIRCPQRLNELAKGMAMYLREYGDNRWFPYPLGRGLRRYDYSGGEWLASLYWTGVVTDPQVFLCPSTDDSNDDGADLGVHRAIERRYGPATVSYAGMHYYSLRDKEGKPIPGAIPADYPPDKPMASDDTQGDFPNHGTMSGGGMSILFFDGHVEFRTSTELHLLRAVGDTDPDALLGALRN
jgi:prepilin-type processing-associated H-X9-DG protein